MIETPRTTVRNNALVVFDHRTHHPLSPLRFWGGVLIGLAAVSVLIFPEFRSTDPSQLVVPLTTAAVGTLLLVAAGRAKRQMVTLAELEPAQGLLRIHPEASSLFADLDRRVWLDEVHDILFGMTMFPMERGSSVKVEAFSVCVRLYDGSVLPVVEATIDKGAAFDVARDLSEAIGVPIHQTGIGI